MSTTFFQRLGRNDQNASTGYMTRASCIKSIDQLWFNASGVASGAGLRTGRRCLLLRRIQFQQAVNPVYTLMIPGITLPAKHLKEFLHTVSRIALRHFSKRLDHRLITPGIGLIKIHCPAQR